MSTVHISPVSSESAMRKNDMKREHVGEEIWAKEQTVAGMENDRVAALIQALIDHTSQEVEVCDVNEQRSGGGLPSARNHCDDVRGSIEPR